MSELTPEEYLDKKVKIIFEPLVSQMILSKPDNPVIKLNLIDIASLYDRLASENIWE